jgi:hypothetical protein
MLKGAGAGVVVGAAVVVVVVVVVVVIVVLVVDMVVTASVMMILADWSGGVVRLRTKPNTKNNPNATSTNIMGTPKSGGAESRRIFAPFPWFTRDNC